MSTYSIQILTWAKRDAFGWRAVCNCGFESERYLSKERAEERAETHHRKHCYAQTVRPIEESPNT